MKLKPWEYKKHDYNGNRIRSVYIRVQKNGKTRWFKLPRLTFVPATRSLRDDGTPIASIGLDSELAADLS